MDLPDLNDDELLVLIGFLRAVMRADGTYSDQEKGYIASLSEQFGAERFRDAMNRAYDVYPDMDTLKEGAKTLGREPAKQLILDACVHASAVDGVAEAETLPLSWMARTWNLTPGKALD